MLRMMSSLMRRFRCRAGALVSLAPTSGLSLVRAQDDARGGHCFSVHACADAAPQGRFGRTSKRTGLVCRRTIHSGTGPVEVNMTRLFQRHLTRDSGCGIDGIFRKTLSQLKAVVVRRATGHFHTETHLQGVESCFRVLEWKQQSVSILTAHRNNSLYKGVGSLV